MALLNESYSHNVFIFGLLFIGPKKVRKPKSDDDGDMSTDENDEDEDEMSVDDTLDENLFEIPANFAEDPSRYCQILAMNIHKFSKDLILPIFSFIRKQVP